MTAALIFSRLACTPLHGKVKASMSRQHQQLMLSDATRYPNAETNFLCRNDRSVSSPSLVKLVHAPLRTVCQSCPTSKIARRKRAKSSITRRWIIRFRSNFVQSLNAWHQKCFKSSNSRNQRSRSQVITCAKIRKIMNNSAGDCSISLKFRTDFDHMTLDVPRTFKVNGSKVKVTAWHNVSA